MSTLPPPATGPPRAVAPQVRVHYLDGLRALAALWVVCNHILLTVHLQVGDSAGLLGAATDWMAYGHFAVVAFLVLSGYSLALAYTDDQHRVTIGVREFFARRFFRIVLPYWAALLVSGVLALTVLRAATGTHWDSAIPVTARGIVLHILLLQDFGTTAQLNHALWSIAIEWHIYLLFAPFLWLRRRIGLPASIAATMAAGIAISSRFDGGLTLWEEANLAGCFALGVAAHEISVSAGARSNGACGLTSNRARRLGWRALTAAVAVATVVICWCLGTLRAAEQTNTLLEPLAGLTTAGLLVVLAQPRSVTLRRMLSARWLAGIGSFAYSIYLIHAPVVQLAWQYVMRPLGLPLHDGWALATLLALGLPASIGSGWGFYRLVERHCIPRRRDPSNDVGPPHSAHTGIRENSDR